VLDDAISVGQVRPLLPGASDCTMIVTSRHYLADLIVRDGAAGIVVDVLPAESSAALLGHVAGSARVEAEPEPEAEPEAAAAAAVAAACGHPRSRTPSSFPIGSCPRGPGSSSGDWGCIQVPTSASSSQRCSPTLIRTLRRDCCTRSPRRTWSSPAGQAVTGCTTCCATTRPAWWTSPTVHPSGRRGAIDCSTGTWTGRWPCRLAWTEAANDCGSTMSCAPPGTQ
jgi:hypothetical protein